MASRTTQPTVGLLLLAALIVAALGTRPGDAERVTSVGEAEGPETERPDARTLRDLAGLSVGIDTLRRLGSIIETAPAAIEAANQAAADGVDTLATAATALREASAQMLAALPAAANTDASVVAQAFEEVLETDREEAVRIAARLGLMEAEAVRSWGRTIAGAMARARQRAGDSIETLHAAVEERAAGTSLTLGDLADRLARAAAPLSSGLRLYASAGLAERAAPAPKPAAAPSPGVLLSPEPVLPPPTGHGGWWSPMGADIPGFEHGWYDAFTDSMLPHDRDIPHAR